MHVQTTRNLTTRQNTVPPTATDHARMQLDTCQRDGAILHHYILHAKIDQLQIERLIFYLKQNF